MEENIFNRPKRPNNEIPNVFNYDFLSEAAKNRLKLVKTNIPRNMTNDNREGNAPNNNYGRLPRTKFPIKLPLKAPKKTQGSIRKEQERAEMLMKENLLREANQRGFGIPINNEEEEGEQQGREQLTDEILGYKFNLVGRILYVEEEEGAKCKVIAIKGSAKNTASYKNPNTNKNQLVLDEEMTLPVNYQYNKYEMMKNNKHAIMNFITSRFKDVANYNITGVWGEYRNLYGFSRTERAVGIFANTDRNNIPIYNATTRISRALLARPPVIMRDYNIYYMRSQSNSFKRYPYKVMVTRNGNSYSCNCPDFTISRFKYKLYLEGKLYGSIRIGFTKKVVFPEATINQCKHIRLAYADMNLNNNDRREGEFNKIQMPSINLQQMVKENTNEQLSRVLMCKVDNEGNPMVITDRDRWRNLPFNYNLESLYDGYMLVSDYFQYACSTLNVTPEIMFKYLNNCFGWNSVQRGYYIAEKLSYFIRPYKEVKNKENLAFSQSTYSKVKESLNDPLNYMVYYIPEVDTPSFSYWISTLNKRTLTMHGQIIIYSNTQFTCTCYEYTNLNVEYCQHKIAFYWIHQKRNNVERASVFNNKIFQGLPINIWLQIHKMDQKGKGLAPQDEDPILYEKHKLTINNNNQVIENQSQIELKRLTRMKLQSYYSQSWKRDNYSIVIAYDNRNLTFKQIKSISK